MIGRTVDIHAHLVPRDLLEATPGAVRGVEVTEHGHDQFTFTIAGISTRILPGRLIDTEDRYRWMDNQGIDVQVVGTWADLFGYSLEKDEGTAWTRLLNDTLMSSVRDSDRLEAFASLPMQAPERAAAMVADLAGAGFVGVTFATRIRDTELDDPKLEAVWKSLSEHKMPAFIHPGYADADPRTADYGMINAVGRPVDTTIAVARLLAASIPQRFPGVRIIVAHGGGAAPFILGRLRRNAAVHPEIGDPDPGLERLSFDSVVFDPDTLCYLVDKASEGSVMMGSDYPFPIGDPSPMDIVMTAECLTDAQRRSIRGGAATELFDLVDSHR